MTIFRAKFARGYFVLTLSFFFVSKSFFLFIFRNLCPQIFTHLFKTDVFFLKPVIFFCKLFICFYKLVLFFKRLFLLNMIKNINLDFFRLIFSRRKTCWQSANNKKHQKPTIYFFHAFLIALFKKQTPSVSIYTRKGRRIFPFLYYYLHTFAAATKMVIPDLHH